MKSVMIVFNQALTERVNYMFQQLRITGYTMFPLVYGAGTNGGEPRMGSHTWPEMNSCYITVVEDEMVPLLLKYSQRLDETNKANGLRVFVWNIEQTY